MNDVERRVVKFQVVDISDRDAEIVKTSLSSQPQCCRDRGRRRVDANNGAACQPFGEVDGDRSGPDAHVKEPVRRFEPRQQVRRGILGGTPLVGSKD
jgi:hypothetical protein